MSLEVKGLNKISLSLLIDLSAGRYHIVLHYYQPDHPSFESKTGVYSGGGGGLPGRVDFQSCPNLDGCRVTVKAYANRPYVFEAGDSRIRIDIPGGKDAWLVSLFV